MGNCCVNIIVNYSCKSSLCNKWTVTGKVSDVTRTAGSQKPDLHFDYDAMGQRISKTVTNKNTTDGTDKFVTTYYVRDPQGNVLAVYVHKHGDSDNGTFTLTEQHLYGAGRLGMRKRDLALNTGNANESPANYYELTNRLGNVMAVISDEASTAAEPTVVSLSDYYPYGMAEPGRSWNAGDYRFGYTGHEKESDLAEGVYTTEYRLLDTRLGRWLSVDKMAGDFAWMSPYNYCEGNPMMYWDPNGKFGIITHKSLLRNAIESSGYSFSEEHVAEMMQGTGSYADITLASDESVHLDNKLRYVDVENGYCNAADNLVQDAKEKNYLQIGKDLHTIGDFYSHSNYIDLFLKYMDKNPGIANTASDIPTFGDVISSEGTEDDKWKDFRENYLKGNLRTGTYGSNPPRTTLVGKLFDKIHDWLTTDDKSHGRMNLDKNKRNGNGGRPFNDAFTKHEAAKDVAQRDIDSRFKENVINPNEVLQESKTEKP